MKKYDEVQKGPAMSDCRILAHERQTHTKGKLADYNFVILRDCCFFQGKTEPLSKSAAKHRRLVTLCYNLSLLSGALSSRG
jgi:hypothetical protein